MDIYNIALDILKDKTKLNFVEMNDKYSDFKKTKIHLYNLLLSSNFDENNLDLLKFMCEKADKINNKKEESTEKEITENTKSIEKEIGDRLAEKYLYDKFEKPSEEQLEDARKKLEENRMKIS